MATNAEDDRPLLTVFDQDLNEIASEVDELSALEQANSILAEVSFETLEPKVYFVEIQAHSSAVDDLSYRAELDIDRPQEEDFCFPIIAQNGAAAVIFL